MKLTLPELAEKIREEMITGYEITVQPCSIAQYDRTKKVFQSNLNLELPDAYRTIMMICNGVEYNGLTIPPAWVSDEFEENIHAFNADMQDMIGDGLIFLGRMDEELYVWDLENNIYCAKDMGGLPTGKEFNSAEEMFTFLLRRAMYMDAAE